MGQILAGLFTKVAHWGLTLWPCAKLAVECGVLIKTEQSGLGDLLWCNGQAWKLDVISLLAKCLHGFSPFSLCVRVVYVCVCFCVLFVCVCVLAEGGQGRVCHELSSCCERSHHPWPHPRKNPPLLPSSPPFSLLLQLSSERSLCIPALWTAPTLSRGCGRREGTHRV